MEGAIQNMEKCKTIIFGAGEMGHKYYKSVCSTHEWEWISVIAFVDNNPKVIGSHIENIPVLSPTDIANTNFDKIIISTRNDAIISDIIEQLKLIGVSNEKIDVLEYSGRLYNRIVHSREIWLKDFANYVYRNNISGNVAECGVYRGEFARCINECFHDRKLYLFDTFDGFDKRDIDIEVGLNEDSFVNSRYNKVGLFQTTSIELVMNKMLHKHNVIIKSGYFPQTAVDVDDQFCFVNLDMDLYAPMRAGLEFFHNKMVPGGIILIHDYLTPELKGVGRALEDFESIALVM